MAKFPSDDEHLSFDDVLLAPQFSLIESRKDVSLDTNFLGLNLKNPIISSNMDSVTGFNLASAMSKNGALSCLHRFQTIQENVNQYYNAIDLMVQTHSPIIKPIVSIGVHDNEYERALALAEAGATHFLIDIAHGASINAVKQYDRLRARLNDNAAIIVGNFATTESIEQFNASLKSRKKPDAFKVGIGGGSACTTRIVSGSGIPTFSSVFMCSHSGFPIIADGGIRNSGDYAKAIAAGASLVMVGRLLAGTDESSGLEYHNGVKIRSDYHSLDYKELKTLRPDFFAGNVMTPEGIEAWGLTVTHKGYRGSASNESYEVQGKTAEHRTAEGESMLVPYTGSVKSVLDQMAAGLRSAMTYTGARTIKEFQEKTIFLKITSSGHKESQPHGKENN